MAPPGLIGVFSLPSAVVAILVAASVCCGSRVPGPTSPATEPDPQSNQDKPPQVTLRAGGTYDVPGRGATVTFVRVTEDSRCPTGVNCVWEGDAAVELRVQAGAAAPATVQLHTNDRFDREATAGGLRLRLESLEPYPQADRAIAAGDYRIVLSISTQ